MVSGNIYIEVSISIDWYNIHIYYSMKLTRFLGKKLDEKNYGNQNRKLTGNPSTKDLSDGKK